MNLIASFAPLLALGCVVTGFLLWRRGRTPDEEMIRVLLFEELGTGDGDPAPPFTRGKFTRERLWTWCIGGLVGGAIGVSLGKLGALGAGPYALLGGTAGELWYRGGRDRFHRRRVRQLELHLPNAMERVVMAVGAGLDIIPALSEAARKGEDPVSDIFRSIVTLSEGGLRVEHALRMTADTVSSTAVKHAFIHLALAYKQGGEIVRPLKELSDATQTQYQESVEEEIAKLPVRAVLPLILTFTGLIVCFLTVPIVQVGASLEKFSHAAE